MSACSAGRDPLVTVSCYDPLRLAESDLLISMPAVETDVIISTKDHASFVRYRTDRFVLNS